MFGWSAEQVTEITMEEVDLEFTPSVTNTERRVTNLEFVLQQKHAALMALTSYEANDIVASSRKNRWKWSRQRIHRFSRSATQKQ